MIDQIQLETGQMATQISKDAIGADVARWIARIERDQRAQMFKGCPQQFAHCACSRLTCAHSVELMPYRRMNPSASCTPQSADCA